MYLIPMHYFNELYMYIRETRDNSFNYTQHKLLYS